MIGTEFFSPRRQTWLARRDPRLKLAWLLTVSLASVVVDSSAALLLLFAVTLLAALALGWRVQTWLAVGTILAAIAWATVLSQALFYPGDPRTVLLEIVRSRSLFGWEFPGVILYREGAFYGLVQSLRLLAMTLAGLTVCLSTGPQQLLAALVTLRVPVAVGFMSVAALRFLPTILQEWLIVRRTSRLRGYGPRWIGAGLLRTLKTEVALLVPVIAAALRRAATLATSLTARGFDATAPRSVYPAMAFTRSERVALGGLASIAVALSSLKSLYWLVAGGYLTQAALDPLCDFVGRWL